MENQHQENYYTNPAFCQQSEFYNLQQQRKSPLRSPQRQSNNVRQPPVGAQSPARVLDTCPTYIREELPPKPGPKPQKYLQDEESYEEQEFYEEMLVDETGLIQQKNIVVISSPHDQKNGNVSRYARVPQSENQRYLDNRYVVAENNNGNRYAVIPTEDLEQSNRTTRYQKHRYEYIPMQEHDVSYHRRQANYNTTPQKLNKSRDEEEIEFENGRIHRYAVIPMEEETELNISRAKYVEESKRYATIPQNDSMNQTRRYEYITHEENHHQRRINQQNFAQSEYQRSNNERRVHENVPPLNRQPVSPPPHSPAAKAIATQKLHELLSTPKKTQSPKRITSPHSPRRTTPHASIIKDPKDPFVTPKKSPQRIVRQNPPKAQQKLNYVLSTRQMTPEKRNTAIVAPICSSPVQSVYSETTYSNQSESWMNISLGKQPVQATLAAASLMMMLCGGLAAGLCFYMVSVMGRLYYLDFGIVSGFACLLLGILGFRSRNYYYWLPNRNYMSGYIILTLFSLLTCVGLLMLLFMQPKPGSPLADMTSGAVCGISVLSLVLASGGVISSYCCKYPPPDNRVQHCARGFTV